MADYKNWRAVCTMLFIPSFSVFVATVFLFSTSLSSSGDSYSGIFNSNSSSNTTVYPGNPGSSGNSGSSDNPGSSPAAAPKSSSGSPENGGSMFSVTGVSLVTSFMTSVISLLGIVTTSLLSWKKDKREKEAFDIDNERKKLENEKMKYEVEQLKNSKPKRKSKNSKE